MIIYWIAFYFAPFSHKDQVADLEGQNASIGNAELCQPWFVTLTSKIRRAWVIK
jgi:hypothetical protein